MDVLDTIRNTNFRIKSLFDQIKGESGKQQRKLLFDNIKHDIELHFYAEEQVFYPALRNYQDLKPLINDLVLNHNDIRLLVKNLAPADQVSVDFENRIVELINHFDDHVAREEGELFVVARKILKANEREKIGRLFTSVQQEREEAA
jgi:hemerythrin superfamily protein